MSASNFLQFVLDALRMPVTRYNLDYEVVRLIVYYVLLSVYRKEQLKVENWK